MASPWLAARKKKTPGTTASQSPFPGRTVPVLPQIGGPSSIAESNHSSAITAAVTAATTATSRPPSPPRPRRTCIYGASSSPPSSVQQLVVDDQSVHTISQGNISHNTAFATTTTTASNMTRSQIGPVRQQHQPEPAPLLANTSVTKIERTSCIAPQQRSGTADTAPYMNGHPPVQAARHSVHQHQQQHHQPAFPASQNVGKRAAQQPVQTETLQTAATCSTQSLTRTVKPKSGRPSAHVSDLLLHASHNSVVQEAPAESQHVACMTQRGSTTTSTHKKHIPAAVPASMPPPPRSQRMIKPLKPLSDHPAKSSSSQQHAGTKAPPQGTHSAKTAWFGAAPGSQGTVEQTTHWTGKRTEESSLTRLPHPTNAVAAVPPENHVTARRLGGESLSQISTATTRPPDSSLVAGISTVTYHGAKNNVPESDAATESSSTSSASLTAKGAPDPTTYSRTMDDVERSTRVLGVWAPNGNGVATRDDDDDDALQCENALQSVAEAKTRSTLSVTASLTNQRAHNLFNGTIVRRRDGGMGNPSERKDASPHDHNHSQTRSAVESLFSLSETATPTAASVRKHRSSRTAGQRHASDEVDSGNLSETDASTRDIDPWQSHAAGESATVLVNAQSPAEQDFQARTLRPRVSRRPAAAETVATRLPSVALRVSRSLNTHHPTANGAVEEEERGVVARREKRKSVTELESEKRCRTRNDDNLHLEPYDAPAEEPVIPDGLAGKWSFDAKSRVLLGKFEGMDEIPREDKEFILLMMQDDHICVVIEGIMLEKSTQVSSRIPLTEISKNFGWKPYHKFRRFDREVTENGNIFYRESGFVSMKVSDFVEYIGLREGKDGSNRRFVFKDVDEAIHVINNVDDCALYMIDVDMPKYLPKLCEDYKYRFKMKEILPGGSFCMMNALPETARPFMGPNLYVTPGGSFTSFHQDGHGTVDSGHTCISGYNEVVMLRRLPENHKRKAMDYLPEGEDNDALYDLPHNSVKTDLKIWPSTDTVEEWERMNYCPSVFTLKPGQHLHLNKGRLHCFRKATPDPLQERDCHSILRQQLVEEVGTNPSTFLCYSIAFDWMFLGWTSQGIEREVTSSLECAKLCRDHNRKSLAVPATALLQMASTIGSTIGSKEDASNWKPWIEPDPFFVCSGILQPLAAVVKQEMATSSKNVKRARIPDSYQDPGFYPIDPFGNSDYTCKICNAELSNTYFHCLGCELLLKKDMNICLVCFEEGKYYQKVFMHPFDRKATSDLNHTGEKDKKRNKQSCPCHQGICKNCKFCRMCSCKCHFDFQQNRRFFEVAELESILEECEEIVAPGKKKGTGTNSGNSASLPQHEPLQPSYNRNMVGALVEELEYEPGSF